MAVPAEDTDTDRSTISGNMSDHDSPRRDSAASQTAMHYLPSVDTVNKKEKRRYSARWEFRRCICGRRLESASERVVRLTYLYGCVHGAVDQLLPACFKALERDMGFTPQSLGIVSSATRIAHVLTCPIWGLIIDCCGRRRIFSSTALGWGAAASALLYATQKWHILPLMCAVGIFMAAMGPLSQKVIAQEVPEDDRGRSFGMLHFFQSFGRVLSLTVATSVSGFRLWGIQGWRHALVGFGLFSIVMGIIFGSCVTDAPQHLRRQKEQGRRWFSLRDTVYVFSNGSVWIMLLMVRHSSTEETLASSLKQTIQAVLGS